MSTSRTSRLRVFPTRQQIDTAEQLFDDPEPPVRQLAPVVRQVPASPAPAVAQAGPARPAIMPTHSVTYRYAGLTWTTTVCGRLDDVVAPLAERLRAMGAEPISAAGGMDFTG